jgi:heptosyltransferase-2
MATPTLRLIRRAFPGMFIGVLCRPGIDRVLAGLDVFDELHVERSAGVMGPKFVAARLRPRRYDTALLLTNSFSTALITRIAGIPRRIGYARDARGLLLTDRSDPPRRPDGRWAPVPAVDYYHNLAAAHLLPPGPAARRRKGLDHNPSTSSMGEVSGGATVVSRPEQGTQTWLPLPTGCFMELAVTPADRAAADDLLARGGVDAGAPLVLLNPGGNRREKRWPPDRFAAVADHLAGAHAMTALVNGSPAEAELAEGVSRACAVARPVSLPALGVTLSSLKGLVARCRLMVSNDTGPRHIALALGVPCVSLFGPTDHRWTIVPTRAGAPDVMVLAEPHLPDDQVADDHPDRCRIDRIEVGAVISACEQALSGGPPGRSVRAGSSS